MCVCVCVYIHIQHALSVYVYAYIYTSNQIFKKKGLDGKGPIIFRRALLGQRRVSFFRGLQFSHKK